MFQTDANKIKVHNVNKIINQSWQKLIKPSEISLLQ